MSHDRTKARALIERLWARARLHGPTVILEGGVNVVLPLLIYDALHQRFGDVTALLVSSAPPLLWSLAEFARRRKIDAVSLLVLAGIALSVLAYIGGGSARLLQLREKLVTVLIGVVFLISAIIGKPLIYELARAGLKRSKPADVAAFEAMRDNHAFRRSMTFMTLVWGFGLLADAAVSVVLVFSLSIHDYLLIGPMVGYGSLGLLSAWTFWYGRRQQAKGDARRAALAKASSSDPSV